MLLVGDPRGNHPLLALVQYVNCRAQRFIAPVPARIEMY